MNRIKPYFNSVNDYIDLLRETRLEYSGRETSSVGVSIISSFYNVPSEYFLEANSSILNQTFQNYEWIIADDCSTIPEAITLFNSLTSINPKITTIRRQANGGLAAGRNTAIQQAQGQYLFFMDTDDLLDPTLIEKCVLFLETHHDFSFVNTYSVGFQSQEYWWEKGFEQPSCFIEENRVTGRLLYRKADFDEVGGFDESLRFYEDWERWLKAIAHGQKGWTIPEFLDCYRRTESGLLASSRRRVAQEQQVKSTIQKRYRHFFETHALPDIEIERPMFELPALRRRLEVENPVNEDFSGKRILCYFPHLEIGGADKFNLDLLSHLKQRGYRLTIITTVLAEHRWFSEFYRITADIFHLPNLAHYGHWLTISKYLIESRHIDTVFISNAYYAYYLLPGIRQSFPNLAVVDYTHTEDPGWRSGGYPRVSCQFNSFLDRQLVTSQYLADLFVQINPSTVSKIEVCPINVDEQQWKHSKVQRHRIRQRLKIADGTPLILFPARLTSQKRPLFFLDIVQHLVRQGLAVKVLMLGDGELEAAVSERIVQSGLTSIVNLCSSVKAEEMLGYYSAADLVLMPSAYEGISLVMYEAMSMELPVVASDVGGQRELLTPTAGHLVPLGKGDTEECNSYLQVLSPLLTDMQLLQSMGKAARRRIEKHFRLESMVDQVEKVFQIAQEKRRVSSQAVSNSVTSSAVTSSLNEELLLWVQEFLALDRVWHETQHLGQQLKASEAWARLLEQERDLHRTESLAWQKVAQRNQLELNRIQNAH